MKLPNFKLERYFAQYEFNVSYLLCASDCESFSIQELLDFEPTATAAFQQQWLGYAESRGGFELRQEIAKLYQHMTPDNILVHVGAQEAIFNFMNVALSANDHVIVHFPCYQSLFEIAQSIGCEVTMWQTKEADNWELSIDFLRANLKQNTKAIVLNCPHNPTGYLLSHDKFGEILALAKQHNLLIFFDEVYRGLEYRAEDRLPSACDVYENAISLGVMSKSYGLAGLRLGWIATKNEDIYQRMASFKDFTTICNSTPSEFLAILALRHQNEIMQRNLGIIRHNLALLNDFFARHEELFTWQSPKAGCIAFPSLKLHLGAEQFCLDLVQQKGVLLLPSNHYDFGNRNFRIGFGRKNMPESLAQLEEFIV